MTVECAPLFQLDPDAVACPYPLFARLRRNLPVHYSEELRSYVVTRYDDALAVLRDTDTFSSSMPTGPKAAAETLSVMLELIAEDADLREVLGGGTVIGATPVLLNADPPAHDRQRALVKHTFSPRRVRLLGEEIRDIAQQLVAAFPAEGPVEFVRDFAVPLPMTVISRALGVPEGELATFKRWSDDFTVAIGNHLLSKDRLAQMLRSQVEFARYFEVKIEERRTQRQDDLISDVVYARLEDGTPLTDAEMLGMFAQFLVAGNETTAKLLSSCALVLAQAPQLAARLAADRSLLPAFVEETLRLQPPVQGLFRTAVRHAEVGGVTIPSGSSVWVVYASANRDTDEFADAEEMLLDRSNGMSHLAFGKGAHFCLGATLARAEARVALDVLLDEFVSLRVPDGARLEYEPSYVLHGLRALPLELRRATTP